MSILLLSRGLLKPAAGGGGGGGITQIFAPSAGVLNANDDNPNTAFRVACTLAAAVVTQVRVTFSASSAGALLVSNASFAKGNGDAVSGTYGDATATPVELLFSGASGFSISAGAQKVSDWLNVSGLGLTTGDIALVSFSSGSNGGQRYRNSLTNANTWYSGNTTIWNQQIWGSDPGKVASTSYCIEKIETQ